MPVGQTIALILAPGDSTVGEDNAHAAPVLEKTSQQRYLPRLSTEPRWEVIT